MNATATFQTKHAARHMVTLCTHFSKRVPAQAAAESGHVEFPFGHCALRAEAERLTLTASAKDRSQLERVVEVVTRHLERFAFRENPTLSWDFTDA